MTYTGLPQGLWLLFAGSFRQQLQEVLAYDAPTAREITDKAHRDYQRIIRRIPPFERGDRFVVNIASAAMLAAFYRQMDPKPDIRQMTTYYEQAMMTTLTGLVVVLMMVVPEIARLFDLVKSLFHL